MPQMSPMYWLMLMFYFILIMLFSMTFIYFYYSNISEKHNFVLNNHEFNWMW
uniref:ATP synthase F0 subunit 8 n=1 Tax=Chonosia crassipennis TaxID=1986890 RepID=A0A343S5C9_9HEMI|nr:ATP synthase F0 subunit 8 [Chonosia crassipennis]